MQARSACYKIKGGLRYDLVYEVIAPEKWLNRAVKREASVGEERNCCAGHADQ